VGFGSVAAVVATVSGSVDAGVPEQPVSTESSIQTHRNRLKNLLSFKGSPPFYDHYTMAQRGQPYNFLKWAV